MNKPIYLTQPDMPPLAEFTAYPEQIRERRTPANGGPFHQQIEEEPGRHPGVEYISLFANGTLPIASRAADRVSCLPIHPGLGGEDAERIVRLVRGAQR